MTSSTTYSTYKTDLINLSKVNGVVNFNQFANNLHYNYSFLRKVVYDVIVQDKMNNYFVNYFMNRNATSSELIAFRNWCLRRLSLISHSSFTIKSTIVR